MPFTLWRATLADMLRLAALSTAVLVMVIALAATVKPLSDGALRAADLLRFVGLMVVPMMAYALPFAAGFASTLVYHRIAAEREAIAAYAAGISHKSLVFPALVGAVCAGLMLAALTHQIIPGFLQAAQRLITVDVARLLTQEIERGKSVRLHNPSSACNVPSPSRTTRNAAPACCTKREVPGAMSAGVMGVKAMGSVMAAS